MIKLNLIFRSSFTENSGKVVKGVLTWSNDVREGFLSISGQKRGQGSSVTVSRATLKRLAKSLIESQFTIVWTAQRLTSTKQRQSNGFILSWHLHLMLTQLCYDHRYPKLSGPPTLYGCRINMEGQQAEFIMSTKLVKYDDYTGLLCLRNGTPIYLPNTVFSAA